MATEHSMLRSAIDSIQEAQRLLDRYDKKDLSYKFTREDFHSIRGASNMASQGAKAIAELSGYLEGRLYHER